MVPACSPTAVDSLSSLAGTHAGVASASQTVTARRVSDVLWDVQSPITGLVGAAVLLGGAVFLALLSTSSGFVSGGARYVGLLLTVAGAMAAYELFGRRVYRRQFDFASARLVSRESRECIMIKSFGLTVSLLLAAAAFLILGEYGLRVAWPWHVDASQSGYAAWFAAFRVLGPVTLIAAPCYFWLCERHGRWPREEDEMLHLGRGYLALLARRLPDPHFFAALRSIGVKFFFLPVMVVFWTSNTTSFESALGRLIHEGHGFVLQPSNVAMFFECAQSGLILLDLTLAVIGYACTVRLLDTHVRWAEPTLLGWMAALACYPPFSQQVTERYICYVDREQTWSAVLASYPGAFTMCACVILLLFAVYTASTMMFGLRFSNLTHRGILCRGPYSIVRHPAYVSKNLAWWLISLPFLRGPGDCVRLLCWNAIYVLRAWTEERHLMADPLYREYARRVRWRFIPRIV